MNQVQIQEVGKALLKYLRDDINHVELGTAAFNAVAALNRAQNIIASGSNDEWHTGSKYIGGTPLYFGGEHIATFFGDNQETNAARAAALSKKIDILPSWPAMHGTSCGCTNCT